MKYFTPELLERGDSLDDDVANAATDEWEKAILRYRRRWKKIRNAFPRGAQQFEDNRVCLHDARLLAMGQQGDTFVMVLEPEPPAQTLVTLTFTLHGELAIDPNAFADGTPGDYVSWMYEEFDQDRQKRCVFEVLLTNGWSVRLRFRDFHYLIADRLFPVPRAAAQALPAAQPAVSKPA
jgi:hypothetical protein